MSVDLSNWKIAGYDIVTDTYTYVPVDTTMLQVSGEAVRNAPALEPIRSNN